MKRERKVSKIFERATYYRYGEPHQVSESSEPGQQGKIWSRTDGFFSLTPIIINDSIAVSFIT